MKKYYKITFLLIGLCLILSGISACFRLPADITTPNDDEVYIIIEPCKGLDWESRGKESAPLITLKDLSFETGTLDRDYLNPWAGSFKQGDSCFLLTGTIRNGHDQGCWITYSAIGYDDCGNIVSYILDEGPVVGVAQGYIDGDSTAEFTLYMSWSDNVSIVKIHCQISDVMFP